MRSTVRYLRAAIPVALLLSGTLALSHPARASASAARSTVASRAAASGSNLLVNPRATAGDVSAQGWDAVTIPGWQVAAGLPTVVRPGTSGFPAAQGAWPASRGKIFAGGAGGTARLVQNLSLLSPSGQPAPKNTPYRLSAWLGGTVSSWAEVTVRFMSATHRVLAFRTIGPVGRSHPRNGGAEQVHREDLLVMLEKTAT